MHRSRRDRRRGQAVVEFALILPVVLLIVAAVVDFGFMLHSRMTVINAAREGARAAMMRDDGVSISSAVATRVGEVMHDDAPGTAFGVVTQCQIGSHTNPESGWGGCGSANVSDYVRVTVSTTHQTIFAFVFDLFDMFPPDGRQVPLSSRAQMVLEN